MSKRSVKGATYKLVVRGELDDRFAYLFNGMQMKRVEGTTVLSGEIIDQAQLHGFIERIEELGLELLTVEQTSEPSPGSKGRACSLKHDHVVIAGCPRAGSPMTERTRHERDAAEHRVLLLGQLRVG